MSKPPKTDFKALIAGEVAPVMQEPAFPSLPEPIMPQPSTPSEVVVLKPHRARPVEKLEGKGTLKERARQLSLYLEEPVYDQLREIAHVERTKLHPLILEGIDLLLKKRGAPSIKELTRKASV
jgi:hypothetical protein